MPILPSGISLYSPCNPVTTTAPCNKLYQNVGYTVPATAGVYVIFGQLYFVNSTGTVYDIKACPGPCGWGIDCVNGIKKKIQCNVIQGNQNVCTNFTAVDCCCLGLGVCI